MGEKGELDTEGDGVGGDEYTQLYGEQPDKTYVRQQNDKLIAINRYVCCRPWLCRWRIKRRFVVAILAFFGFVNVYMLR